VYIEGRHDAVYKSHVQTKRNRKQEKIFAPSSSEISTNQNVCYI